MVHRSQQKPERTLRYWHGVYRPIDCEARRSVGGWYRSWNTQLRAGRGEVDRNDAKVPHGLAAAVEPVRGEPHIYHYCAEL